MSNFGFVVLAFSLTYLVLTLYAVRLFMRRRTLERHWKERKA
ncbi:MAG: hypothetical protein ACRENP_19845 [Longimicrobiales bacterium]